VNAISRFLAWFRWERLALIIGSLVGVQRLYRAHENRRRESVERKRTEIALRDSETFFRMLFQNSPDSIMLLDPHHPSGEWPIIECNEAACRSNGYTREELIGSSIDILHKHKSKPEELARHLESLKQSGWREFEAYHKHKNGTVFPVHTTSNVIVLGGKELVLGIDRDMTERKRAEAQAIELAIRKDRAQMLEEFVRDASHDFRTPLSTINTSVYLLGKHTDPEKQQYQREIIEQQVQRLNKLVSGMLMMTRLNNSAELKMDSVQLNDVIQTVHLEMVGAIRAKNLTLTLNLRDVPPVLGDEEYLQDALTNILRNAEQYTPSGGSIRVQTQVEGDCTVVEISDSGVGISADEQRRIFAPLYRTDKARSAQTGGAGLGLTIAQKIIEAHGGHIEVESTLGQGSTFRVFVPVYQSPKT
jgi:PAS domain S-box-containing protein